MSALRDEVQEERKREKGLHPNEWVLAESPINEGCRSPSLVGKGCGDFRWENLGFLKRLLHVSSHTPTFDHKDRVVSNRQLHGGWLYTVRTSRFDKIPSFGISQAHSLSFSA